MRLPCTLLVALAASISNASAQDLGAGSLSRRELLAAAFPDWKPALGKDGKPVATMIDAIAMPSVHWPWIDDNFDSGSDDDATTVQVVPMNVTRLDETHAVLTTWMLPIRADVEAACDSYYCHYALGTYFFTLKDARWHLSHRVDVASNAYGSEAPKARVEAWPGKGFVLGDSQKYCKAGYCVEHLTLLGLEPDQVLFEFQSTVAQSGSGIRPIDCSQMLDPSFKLPEEAPASLECNEAQGKWHVDGDAIRIDFEETSRTTIDGVLQPVTEANFFARLVPKDGKLVLVSGRLGDYGI